MALFNKNNNDEAIRHIHRKIDMMNNLLCHIENSLNQFGGLVPYNELRVSAWLEKLIEHQTETEVFLRQLTTREQQQLKLKWMDGRLLPLPLWNSSYIMIMAQLQRLFKEYIKRT